MSVISYIAIVSLLPIAIYEMAMAGIGADMLTKEWYAEKKSRITNWIALGMMIVLFLLANVAEGSDSTRPLKIVGGLAVLMALATTIHAMVDEKAGVNHFQGPRIARIVVLVVGSLMGLYLGVSETQKYKNRNPYKQLKDDHFETFEYGPSPMDQHRAEVERRKTQ